MTPARMCRLADWLVLVALAGYLLSFHLKDELELLVDELEALREQNAELELAATSLADEVDG